MSKWRKGDELRKWEKGKLGHVGGNEGRKGEELCRDVEREIEAGYSVQ